MKIHVWNAFASNNSGSYVLVGRFANAARAAEVASELSLAAEQHAEWLRRRSGGDDGPLHDLARRLGFDARVSGDDWPDDGFAAPPQVWAAGHQVFVHAPYTITLTTAFGHALYALGGRVESEIDHAHHPVVCLADAWLEERDLDDEARAARVQALVDRLCEEDAGWLAHTDFRHGAAWMRGAVWFEPHLRIAAVFGDLCGGVRETSRLLKASGFACNFRVAEAWGDALDPLAQLRSSEPTTNVTLMDVSIDAPLSEREAHAAAWLVAESFGIDWERTVDVLLAAPGVLGRMWRPARAEALRDFLADLGVQTNARVSPCSRAR